MTCESSNVVLWHLNFFFIFFCLLFCFYNKPIGDDDKEREREAAKGNKGDARSKIHEMEINHYSLKDSARAELIFPIFISISI